MKHSRFLSKRFVLAALMVAVTSAAFAQQGGDFGGPPGGRGGRGMGGRGGRMGGPQRLDRLPPIASLVDRPEVVAELGLSDDQRAAIDEIARSVRPMRGGPGGGPGGGPDGGPDGQGGPGGGGLGGDGGPGGPPDRMDRDKAEAAAEAKIKALLTPVQAQRLAEIQIQAMGLSAAMVPAIQTKLGLTADQKAQLKTLVPARPEGGPGGPDGGPGGPGGGSGDDRGGPPPGGPGGGDFGGPPQSGPEGRGGPGGPNDVRRKALEAKIAAILTDEQKASLKAMGGKPFAMRPPQGPRGGN